MPAREAGPRHGNRRPQSLGGSKSTRQACSSLHEQPASRGALLRGPRGGPGLEPRADTGFRGRTQGVWGPGSPAPTLAPRTHLEETPSFSPTSHWPKPVKWLHAPSAGVGRTRRSPVGLTVFQVFPSPPIPRGWVKTHTPPCLLQVVGQAQGRGAPAPPPQGLSGSPSLRSTQPNSEPAGLGAVRVKVTWKTHVLSQGNAKSCGKRNRGTQAPRCRAQDG